MPIPSLKASRIFFNGIASVAAQGTNFALSMLLIAVIQRNMGVEILGVWMAVTTVILALSISDFGIGNALIALTSRLQPKLRSLPAAELAVAGTALTTTVGAALFLMLWASDVLGAWPILLGFTPSSLDDHIGQFFLYFAVYIGLMLPISVIERLQIGDNKAFTPKSLEVLGGLISIPLVLGLITPDSTLAFALVLRFLPHALLRIANSLWFWSRNRLHWRHISPAPVKAHFHELLGLSGSFFFMGIATALTMNTDIFVIATILGAEHVPEYAVPLRIVVIPTLFSGLYIAALWPAYAKAMSQGDAIWIKTVFYRALTLATSVTLVFNAVFLWTAADIVEIWLGTPLELPSGMLIAQSAWVMLAVLGAVATPLLNAAKMERFQAKASLWMVALNIPLSVLLVREFGTPGAMWGTTLSTLFALTVPSYLRVFTVLRAEP